MRMKIPLLILLAAACLFAQTHELSPYVIDNGGSGWITDGTYETYFSVGQGVIGYQTDAANCNWIGYITNGACATQTQFAVAVGGTGNEQGTSVVQTSDGGYAVAGITESYGAGNSDLLLVKFDAFGSVEWSRAIGGSNIEYGRSVVQTTDGGYAVTGETYSFGAGNRDLFLVKFSSTGSVEWSRAVGGTSDDRGYSVVQTTDGGFAVGGWTWSYGAGGYDYFLVKFDAFGSVEWARAIGGANIDYGNSVVQTTDGGYAIAGETRNYGTGGWNSFLVKLNSSGLIEWARVVGGINWDHTKSVVQTTDGGYAVVGLTESFGAGNDDLFFIKFSSTGLVEWSRAVGGAYDDEGYSVVQTTDGGYVVAGITGSYGAGSFDFFLVQFNSSGSVVWSRAIGGASVDWGKSVVQTTDGGYAVVGLTESYGIERDLFLVKFDSDGNSCIGEAISPTVTDCSPSVASPSPTVTSPSPTVTSVSPTVTDIAPTVTNICPIVDYITISGTLTYPPGPGCDGSPFEGAHVYFYESGIRVDGEPVSDAFGYYVSGPLTSGGDFCVSICYENHSSIPRTNLYPGQTTNVTDCDFVVVPIGDFDCSGAVQPSELWDVYDRMMVTSPVDPNDPFDVACDSDCDGNVGADDLWKVYFLMMDTEYDTEVPCNPCEE